MLMTRGAKLDLKDKVRTVMVRCMPTQKQHECKWPGYHCTYMHDGVHCTHSSNNRD